MQERSVDKIRIALLKWMRSKLPLQIRQENEETITCFIRGFADESRNIVLISDTSDSMSMNIIELKQIAQLSAIKVL